MSRIIYNGIELSLVRTVRWDREVELDGPDYLWTRHTIEVEAIFNPQASSYYSAGQSPGSYPTSAPGPLVGSLSGAGAQPGHLPSVTDRTVRHHLLVPRQQFLYLASAAEMDGTAITSPSGALQAGPGVAATGITINPDDTPLIATPDFSTGFWTDANNGPTPKYCRVLRLLGNRSFIVAFGIEVCLKECPTELNGMGNPLQPPAVLTHRWSERHLINTQGFTTRVVQGRVRFRSDALLNGAVLPRDFFGDPNVFHGFADDYRSQLLHPVPNYFQREQVDVLVSEDGLSLIYQLRDQQRYVHLGTNCPASRFEGFLTLSTVDGGAQYLANIQVRVWGPPGNNQTAAQAGQPAGPGVVQAVVRPDGTLFIPPEASKGLLFQFATQVALSRINLADPNCYVQQGTFTESLHEPYIEVGLVVRLPPSQSNAQGLPLPPTALVDFAKVVGSQNGLTPISADQVANPAPPGDGISRGSWIGCLAAQSLTAACASPLLPGAPAAAPLITTAVAANPQASPATGGGTNQLTTSARTNVLGSKNQAQGSSNSGGLAPLVSVSTTSAALAPSDNNYADTTQTGIWTLYRIDASYLRQEGVFQAPVAGPVAPLGSSVSCEFLNLHAPVMQKVVSWTAERIGPMGTWPSYPNRDTGDVNEVFLSGRLKPGMPEILQDGESFVHRVSGQYVYGLKVPKDFTGDDDFRSGSSPVDDYTLGDTDLPRNQAADGIIGNAGTTTFLGMGNFGSAPAQ